MTLTFFELAKRLDEIVDMLRIETHSPAALALVIDTEGGVHFTVQGDLELITVADVPAILVRVALAVAEDLREKKTLRGKH